MIQRARNRILRKRAPMEDLPDRLVDERDLIRRVLGAGWWKALIYSAGNWLLDLTALLIALAAVGAQPRASVVLLAYVVAAFLGMIPITPGGLGFVEAGLVGTLSLAGIGTDQALLATLVYRLASYWLPIPTGAVAYFLAGAQVRPARSTWRPTPKARAAGRGRRAGASASVAGRLAPVDQVRHREHRVALEHPRPAVAHHLAHALAHRRLVAVRLAVGAGGLVGAVAALLQAEARVGEQLGALGAEPVARVARRRPSRGGRGSTGRSSPRWSSPRAPGGAAVWGPRRPCCSDTPTRRRADALTLVRRPPSRPDAGDARWPTACEWRAASRIGPVDAARQAGGRACSQPPIVRTGVPHAAAAGQSKLGTNGATEPRAPVEPAGHELDHVKSSRSGHVHARVRAHA